MRDFLDALGRDAPAAQDVLEERPDVRRRVRAAEGDHEHGVEGLRHVPRRLYWLWLDGIRRSVAANRCRPRFPPSLLLPRPVWLLGWVSFFTDMATEMIYPLLPLFLTGCSAPARCRSA